MVIRFRQSIGTDRGAFMEGQRVTVKAFPKEWQGWLERGVIVIEKADEEELAVATVEPDTAVRPSGRSSSRRRARRTEISE